MTTNAWDNATKLAEQHATSGSLFVRLANHGDKVIGAFCGEPFAREVVWTGERYENHDPKVHGDKRPTLRVMLNFFVPAEGAMKIIEGGVAWFRDVLKVREKYGLDKWIFEIERHGEAGNPKTTYSILPEEKIDDELRARFTAVDLNDLASVSAGEGRPDGEAAPESKPGTGGGLIDARTASDLVARLKALPRSDVDAFLSKFAVQRVRDLRTADEAKARAFLDQLGAKQTAAPQEIDPFA